MRSDTASVGKHEDEHLRRFVAARGRGDAREMRHWWNELVVDFYDRMDGLVAVAHRGRLDAEEHDLAVAMSLTRFSKNLMITFDGVSIGQLVNACKTLTRGICMDVQRSSIRTHRHEGPSLDASWDADSTDGYTPAWEADEAALRYERDVRGAEERRRVLKLTFHGAELPEIAEELDITRDNAYQRRSRGMKDLKKLKELYDA
jgi:hypothetical protein